MSTPTHTILAGIALALPAVATADTYWVSPDGTGEWNSCAGETPLEGPSACSLATANNNAVAGDAITLRGGTYTGQEIRPGASGTSEGERIVYRGHDGERALIRDSAYGIYIYRQSYITVDRVDVESPYRFLRINAGHHNTISRCNFDLRHPDSGDWAGAIIADDHAVDPPESEDSTHNWVHHCTFFRWVWGAYDENRGALLNIGTDQSAGDDSSFNLVEDNIFAYGGHHTLGVYAHYNVIRNNYIHNETNPEGWDFAGYRGAITEGPSAGWSLYEGNRFGFSDASGIGLRSPHNIFRRNLFYHNGSGGIQVVTNSVGSDQADHNRIYHNTFFHNGHLADYSGFQGQIYFSSWSGVSPVGNAIKNNIFYDGRNGSITYDGDVDPQEIEGNWDQNDVDPGFVDFAGSDPDDPTRPDLRLIDDGAAKDQGTWLTTVTSTDGTGATFTVADASYFMDGWGVIEGDLVQLADQVETARIVAVDYQANSVTLDRALTFSSGQGIALAYAGAAPDQGAFEIGAAAITDAGPITDAGATIEAGGARDAATGVDTAAANDSGSPPDAASTGAGAGCDCRGSPAAGALPLLCCLLLVASRRAVKRNATKLPASRY